MATTEQIDEFTAFAVQLSGQEGGETLSINEICERWWEQQHADEDLAAIEEAHAGYESGERGRPAKEVLADFRRERLAGKKR
jgi:hypothetical protein